MTRWGALLVLFLSIGYVWAQPYQPRDLTAENIFSNNIEGPNVDKAGNLYVVNFQRDGTIGLVKPNGEVELFVTLPEGSVANAIMFDKKGNMLLADWQGHNVLKVDARTKAVSVFVHNDQFNQPNDLCIRKSGKLFASDPNWKENTGKLWRIDGPGKATLLADNMGTTNGIELSPDETRLYVNESVQRTVWVFDVDRKGNISNKKLFHKFEDFGLDGMKCDKQGNLYVTRHGKGTIAILSPKGDLLREVQMKGKLTSNLTFGGPDGKTCFVTLQDRKCVEVFESEVAGKKFQ
ncbi:MAG: SMP-30/gluconolaconase/LRE domain-containing protein [Bacteroidetes bacterium OLB12]|nr:MAG: SMP-30/gluconolaconase/LRE domain-containing protein [Bacteroidetes bacterium OLB12]HNR73834.1 SMP-30/gluconolactonase/LRE family protein [Cyclobacteriaceae bacterium]HNU43356.1 SMP-30/gluconolactonase/LRE family protein [Cyclobacteriaceae bacterium]